MMKRTSITYVFSAFLIAVFLMIPAMGHADNMVPKVDGFNILVDLSGSMGQFKAEKEFLLRLNQTIPELGYKGAVRVFGFTSLITGPGRYSLLEWGPATYSRDAMGKVLDAISREYGITPLGHAMAASTEEFDGMGSRKALIIVSDFERSVDFGDPQAEAQNLKSKYGSVCIYPVYFGTSQESLDLANALAQSTGCGKVFDGNVLASDVGALKSMVAEVFFGVKAAPVTVSLNIEFDTAKAVVKPMYHDLIANAARALQGTPTSTAVIEGHTDSDGSDKYNLKLSQERADAVMNYMVEKFGIDASRLRSVGYGESRPVADNGTAAGKARNRRVDVVISGVQK
jgi:OOP family OmpA-OmpF porin